MDLSIKELLDKIGKQLRPDQVESKRLISATMKFDGWLQPRIYLNRQILIKAVICKVEDRQFLHESFKNRIQSEFLGRFEIKVLSFPYDDIALMRTVVEGLIASFDSDLRADDIIEDASNSQRMLIDKNGYLFLTLIDLPIIL